MGDQSMSIHCNCDHPGKGERITIIGSYKFADDITCDLPNGSLVFGSGDVEDTGPVYLAGTTCPHGALYCGKKFNLITLADFVTHLVDHALVAQHHRLMTDSNALGRVIAEWLGADPTKLRANYSIHINDDTGPGVVDVQLTAFMDAATFHQLMRDATSG